MGSAGGSQDIVGGVHVGDPVPERLVDGILENPSAVFDRYDLGPKLLHPEYIGPLADDIHLSHVNGAVESEFGRHGGRGHAVLAGAGFCNHPFFAHFLNHKTLAHDIIGLMGPGVVEILTFDIYLCPSKVAGQVFGIGQGGGTAGIGGHQGSIPVPKIGVPFYLPELSL